jgi:hypothetical protein
MFSCGIIIFWKKHGGAAMTELKPRLEQCEGRLKTESEFLVDECIFRGLGYLAEALQYYWPATPYSGGGTNPVAERNITLQLSRSFSEKGFLVWAEVPFNKSEAEKDRKIDFLAWHISKCITVALEFKNNIENPAANLKDFERLVDFDLQKPMSIQHGLNGQSIQECKEEIYGVVNIFHPAEFADWWMYASESELPHAHRTADDYKKIASALSVASNRFVTPLVEQFYKKEYWDETHTIDEIFRYRLIRAGYALYNKEAIQKLAAIFANK